MPQQIQEMKPDVFVRLTLGWGGLAFRFFVVEEFERGILTTS